MERNSNQIQEDLISVIMTNYNTPENFLRESIESILSQTYSNFEFIIIDDCSTDDSVSVIKSYKDSRIKLYINEENIGLTKSLNIALDKCIGEFVARMDSDDISEPERFEKQIEYLKKHQDVIVCGTWAKLIGDWKESHTNEYIKRTIPDRETFSIMQLFANNPNIVHPTAMFNRRSLIAYDIRYDEKYIYAQDYKMWKMCNDCAKCAIVSEVLLKYRVHGNAISSSKKSIQDDCTKRIIQEQLDKLHLTLTDDLTPYHVGLLTARKPYDIRIKEWMKEILYANQKYQVYNQSILKKLLHKKWIEISYYGLLDRNTRIQALTHIKITSYLKLLSMYISRKREKNNG